MLFAAELREGTVIRLLTQFERTVPILAVRPASRRLSPKVRVFIEHLEKTSLRALFPVQSAAELNTVRSPFAFSAASEPDLQEGLTQDSSCIYYSCICIHQEREVFPD